MKERKEERIKKNLIVGLSKIGFDDIGLTENISNEGICVGVDKKIPVNVEITFSLAVPDDIFKIKGEVLWCKEVQDVKSNIADVIGIRITEAPPEYQKFVAYSKNQETFPCTSQI
ncbi:MAG TPA: PilZ domain-containing protein [Candidatus Kapabacteria bacterium]|nr:PilZ domain-containing protein [Candidatus Kapabacteria bacterium]